MRVLIDTNVLISAALSANSVPYQAYVKAASYTNHGLICEQNVDEMKRIFNKKFPKRLAALDKFLSKAGVLLTGDKDFLESGLQNPVIITPAEFLNME